MPKPILPGVLIVMVVSMLGGGRAIAKDDPSAPLGELSKAASCADKASPWRPWCIATEWKRGKAVLPKRTLVGITVELVDGADVKDALSNKVTLVALAIEGTRAKLVDIKPTEKGEDVLVAKAVAAVAMVFKGKAKTAVLPPDLAGYIKSRKASYKMTKGKMEVSWTGVNRSMLRKVGSFWVVLEWPTKGNGVWVTVLTDAWK